MLKSTAKVVIFRNITKNFFPYFSAIPKFFMPQILCISIFLRES